MLDLGPAAREVTRLLDGVRDDQLANPTPCPEYPVAALLDHFMGLSLAFTWAARKTTPPGGDLTATGRRSGLPRSVLLQYFPDGEDLIVVAANSGMPTHPWWYYNLQAHPEARVEVAGRTVQVRAEELSPEQAQAFWPRVLDAAPDYARFTQRTTRRIPLMQLEAVDAGA